jgi:CRISPR-associated protein (TIGR02584 family)
MKRYLLAVCGLSPQVITETLYALHQEGRMVDGIRIITTRIGKAEINAHLMSPEDGAYYRLLKEYGVADATVEFSARHIITVTDEHGSELDDIITQDDSEKVLLACMEQAFQLTREPDTTVYFSIAGGRKSMGACLAVAAQCYGRSQDRMYHVLVSPEFESNRNFFYPPMKSRLIELRHPVTREPYHKETRYARITLAPVPFFSIRTQLTDRMLKTPETPQVLMLSLVRDERPELVINLRERKLVWKGHEVDLRPAWIALYAFFGSLKKQAECSRNDCRECADCYRSFVELAGQNDEIAKLYRQTGTSRDIEDMDGGGIIDLSQENFRGYRSKINKELERAYGNHDLAQLQIAAHGVRPNKKYGIPLHQDRISLIL